MMDPRLLLATAAMLALVPAGARAQSGPLTVSTHDGLTLSFSGHGVLEQVSLDGAPLPVLGPGGFFAADVAAASLPLPQDGSTRAGVAALGSAIQSAPNEVTISAELAPEGLRFTGVIRGGAALGIDARVENLRGGDRALTLYFRVPVDAEGWTWSSALGANRALSAGTRAYDAFNWFQAYRTTTSASPVASIADATSGLALAIPPTIPAIYRLSYAAPHGLQVEWELGTAPEPKRFSHAAQVQALLYRVDPKWPLRSALKRLYLSYPELWAKRARDGTWHSDHGDVGTISQPADFALQWVQTYSWEDAYIRTHGLYAMKYTEPWNDHLELDPTGLRAWTADTAANQAWAEISKGQPRQIAAQAALLSGLIGRDGHYGGWSDPENFTDPEGTRRYVLNPDPEISNFMGFTAHATDVGRVLNRAQSVQEYELFRQWGEKPATAADTYSGLYLDPTNTTGSGWAGWHLFNFRREHFATARAPLVFDPQTGKVALSQALSSLEAVRYFSDFIHERGGLVMANGMPDPFIFFTAAWTDFVSPGEHYDGNLTRLRGMRAALYTKPSSYIFNGSVTEAEFQRALLYAVFPGGAGIEANRAVYRRWGPVMLKLASAGWEPLTFAVTDDSGVLVERYGRLDRGTLHFVVHRESGSEGAVTLAIEKGAHGIRAGVSIAAVNIQSGAAVGLVDAGDMLEVPLSLAREQSVALALSVVSGQAGETRGELLPGPPPGMEVGGSADHPGVDAGAVIGQEAGASDPEKLSCFGCSSGAGGLFATTIGAMGWVIAGTRRRLRTRSKRAG